jgi:hypothetical protein
MALPRAKRASEMSAEMTDTSDTSDVIKKEMMPEDSKFISDWMEHNCVALTELAQHFCRFPGNVEVSFTLKMQAAGDGHFTFKSGDVTASREEIRKAFAEHESKKFKARAMKAELSNVTDPAINTSGISFDGRIQSK